METKIILTPDDTMWWILRPEFIAFVDKIIMSSEQYEKEKNDREKSGFHKMAWDRLSVLVDEEILEIDNLSIPEKTIKDSTSEMLKSIYSNEEFLINLVPDLIFAYEYWIDFNLQKLSMLPGDQKYRKTINNLIPVWESDKKLLQEKGLEAIDSRKEIKYVLMNILDKVNHLKLLNDQYSECPLLALKEYEPFTKYLTSDISSPILFDKSALTYKNTIPSKNLGIVNLPIEPEYDFMRFRLSKLNFRGLLYAIRDNYKSARSKVSHLFSNAEEIAFGIKEGHYSQKVTKDFINVNKDLLKLSLDSKSKSKYLANSFFGLSLIPIPPLSILFGVLGLGSDKIAERIESSQYYYKGISTKGLSAYYSFLESMIDTTRLDKFPEIQRDNDYVISQEKPFWRS